MSAQDNFGLQLAKYTNVAASAILIYDYFITLRSEVQWTWGRKWGIIRTTFTISRYTPFAGALMTSYSAVKIWGTQDASTLFICACAPFNDAVNGIHFLGIIASEGSTPSPAEKRPILLFFSALAILVAQARSQGSLPSLSIHLLSVAPPCVLEGARSSALPYALLMLFEIALISTTVFLRYRYYLGSHGALVECIYRDGLVYMFCITIISTLNVIVIAVLPLSYSEMLNTPQIVAHSVLASRILFNLQVSMEQPLLLTYQSTTSMELLSRPHEFQALSGDSVTADRLDEA
ncbi:hypothetical protein BD769DRAFT_1750424 [Suillus cothurnatus]|nr:hypothetical protein BD769DRAFT_1750424 [Suillus cothurnatus]